MQEAVGSIQFLGRFEQNSTKDLDFGCGKTVSFFLENRIGDHRKAP